MSHLPSMSSLLSRLTQRTLKHRSLESALTSTKNPSALSLAVKVRRTYLAKLHSLDLSDIPHLNYWWECSHGRSCEQPIGFVPVPISVVGPVNVDGIKRMVPLATTEGALIASTSRGVSVLGPTTTLSRDVGMTRSILIGCSCS